MKKYDIIIVLCPGEPEVLVNGKIQFQNIGDDKDSPLGESLYSGGEVRMKAAVVLENRAKKIIVVGGSAKKVDLMKIYLIQNGVNANKIIRIESDSDTNGNLNAVRKILERYNKVDKLKDKIAILTNKYHLRRTRVMGSDILEPVGISPEYMSAEDYVLDELGSFKRERVARNYQEQLGVEDWNNGIYKDQRKSRGLFVAKLYDRDFLIEL